MLDALAYLFVPFWFVLSHVKQDRFRDLFDDFLAKREATPCFVEWTLRDSFVRLVFETLSLDSACVGFADGVAKDWPSNFVHFVLDA